MTDERSETELMRVQEPLEDAVVEGADQLEPGFAGAEVETVDGLPVLAEVRALAPAPPGFPAVQAAAAAATGFIAGAATLALVRRHSARKLARAHRSVPRRAADMLPIVGTRTFLVDVHLLAKPGE